MANRLCRRQTPFASPVITGWSVTKIGGLFHLLLTLWVGSLALAFAGIPNLVYTFSATSLLSYTSWQAWKHSRES